MAEMVDEQMFDAEMVEAKIIDELLDFYSRHGENGLAAYHKELYQNGAFDVDEYGGCDGKLPPYFLMETERLEKKYTLLTKLSVLGLELYNANNKTNYQFVKVIKVIWRICSSAEYHISFEAKDESSVTSTTLQTLAYVECDGEVSVSFCKKKGDPYPREAIKQTKYFTFEDCVAEEV